MKSKLLKTTATSLFALMIVLSAGTAKAVDFVSGQTYVGMDYEMTKPSGSAINTMNGANIHVGQRLNENFGLEAGVSQSIKTDENGVNADVTAPYVDLIGYLPLTANGDVELIGTAGLAYNIADVDVSGVSFDDKNLEFVVGAGGQVFFTDTVSFRAVAKLNDVKASPLGEQQIKYTAGMNYSF